LKALFARAPRVADVDEAEKIHAPDLKLEQPLMTFKTSVPAPRPLEEEELLLMRTLKLHDHSVQTLTELAVSFLQSEYPRAAISAAELAMNRSKLDNEYLKAAYLRATGLYQICDYRACLYIALTA